MPVESFVTERTPLRTDGSDPAGPPSDPADAAADSRLDDVTVVCLGVRDDASSASNSNSRASSKSSDASQHVHLHVGEEADAVEGSKQHVQTGDCVSGVAPGDEIRVGKQAIDMRQRSMASCAARISAYSWQPCHFPRQPAVTASSTAAGAHLHWLCPWTQRAASAELLLQLLLLLACAWVSVPPALRPAAGGELNG